MSLFVGWALSAVWPGFWGCMTHWSATSNLLVWSLISFLLYSYYKYPKLCILALLPSLFCFLIQDDNQASFRRLLEALSDPMRPLWSHHTNIHLIQPPAPETAVISAWCGTLGRWNMRLLFCAFSIWCYLLWACTSVIHYFLTCKCLCCRWQASFAHVLLSVHRLF